MAVTTPSTPRVAGRVGLPPASRARPATALAVALLAACAYAIFAQGAIDVPEQTRLQIGLAVVALVSCGTWLFGSSIAFRAPATAWVGVALLAGFAAWSGLSLLWSVAPDRSWLELNRALSYLMVVVLAIAVGTSAKRGIETIAVGWLVVALAGALYALGGKIAPGFHVLGIIDFNHTNLASRLRAPLDYWNALGLVCVLGVPVGVRVATDATRAAWARLAGLGAVFVLLTTLGMTYSRGGLLACLLAVAVITALGGARLRGLLVFAVALLATLPVLVFAFSRLALVANGVALDARIADGRLLGLVMLACLLALLAAGWGLLRIERRVRWSPRRSARVWRAMAVAATLVGLLMVAGVATADGGPQGFAQRAWDSFTQTRADKVSDPIRLVSSSSGNRWVWWQEAAGAWSDRPLRGWGAGSFPVTHKEYRTVELGVTQPHSVPLQFLAETGLVGAMLALGSLAALLVAALRRVRRLAASRERDLAVALFAGAVAWLAHGLYDWDWDIPGVTVPALLFLGLLAADPRKRAHGIDALAAPDSGRAARVAGLAAAGLVLGLVVVSGALPAWADSKATDALAVPTRATPAELRDAAAEAELAARLDPTSVRGLYTAASIAEGRGRLLDARRYLLQAVERQPSNATAWTKVLRIAFLTADRDGAQAAATRALALDPIGSGTRALAGRIGLFTVPAASSATATGTPLSPGLAPAAPPPTP